MDETANTMPDTKPSADSGLPRTRLIARPILGHLLMDIPATVVMAEEPSPITSVTIDSMPVDFGRFDHATIVQPDLEEDQPEVGGTPPAAVVMTTRGRFPSNRSIAFMNPESTTPTTVEITALRDAHDPQSIIKWTYFGLSSKGVRMEAPFVEKTTEGFRVNGLLTERIARESTRISDWLLQHGIRSEVVLNVLAPKQLPWLYRLTDDQGKFAGHEWRMVTRDQFKANLLQRGGGHLSRHAKDLDAEKRQWLDETEFVVENRATPTPYRLSDLMVPVEYSPDPQHAQLQIQFMLNQTFHALNQDVPPERQLKQLRIPDGQPDEDLVKRTNREQIEQYLSIFARNFGEQLGKLHEGGLAHDFMHIGNVDLWGTFVDLDSIHGSPLGDKPITSVDIARDVQWFIFGVEHAVHTLAELAGDSFRPNDTDTITRLFLRQYAATRWGTKAAARHIPSLIKDMLALPVRIRSEPSTNGYVPWYALHKPKQRTVWRHTEQRQKQWLRHEVQPWVIQALHKDTTNVPNKVDQAA